MTDECCKAAKARLMEVGFEAAKAHVKALREHSDGKHPAPAEPDAVSSEEAAVVAQDPSSTALASATIEVQIDGAKVAEIAKTSKR